MSNVAIFLLGAAAAIFIIALIMNSAGKLKPGATFAETMAKAPMQTKTPLETVTDVGEANTAAIMENTNAVREQTALLRQLLEKQSETKS